MTASSGDVDAGDAAAASAEKRSNGVGSASAACSARVAHGGVWLPPASNPGALTELTMVWIAAPVDGGFGSMVSRACVALVFVDGDESVMDTSAAAGGGLATGNGCDESTAGRVMLVVPFTAASADSGVATVAAGVVG